jgi:hypothetical protein
LMHTLSIILVVRVTRGDPPNVASPIHLLASKV